MKTLKLKKDIVEQLTSSHARNVMGGAYLSEKGCEIASKEGGSSCINLCDSAIDRCVTARCQSIDDTCLTDLIG